MEEKDMKIEKEETLEEAEKLEDLEFEEVDDIKEKLIDKLKNENVNLTDDNKKLGNEVEALKDRLSRLQAEYENYRKRTQKEKEGIYTDACEDVLKNILPIGDNLERAIAVQGGTAEDIKKGVEMTLKSFGEALEKLQVEEIVCDGEFDPNYHNAVMHIEDDSLPKNQVVEVFQKGYKRGDKVLRFSMVKVAN